MKDSIPVLKRETLKESISGLGSDVSLQNRSTLYNDKGLIKVMKIENNLKRRT